jgi:hypothetical protein
MLGVLEHPIFERRVQVLEAVGPGRGRIDRAEEGVGRAKRYREILSDPLGKLPGYIALPHWRNVAGLEAIDGWKRQFVVDAGIVDGKSGWEKAVSHDFMGGALSEWNERYGEPWQARAPKTDRHEILRKC